MQNAISQSEKSPKNCSLTQFYFSKPQADFLNNLGNGFLKTKEKALTDFYSERAMGFLIFKFI